MSWLRILLIVLLAVTTAGCELAGDILEFGVWLGVIAVIAVIAVVAFVVAKIRG